MSQIALQTRSNELEIIEFYLDEVQPDGTSYRGYYGMNVAKVLEIIRIPTITDVPSRHHPAVLGTFNLRGRVLPLVDLAVWLGQKLAPSGGNKVIVSEFSGVVIAFLCSGVTRIHRLTWEQVEAPGKAIRSYSNESITGVIRFDERILFILDMELIIASMDASLDMARRSEEAGLPQADEVSDASAFHILIADDSSSVRKMIGATLEQVGYRVTRTASGREAWGVLSAWKDEAAAEGVQVQDKVQLVISDIEMPEMDGHALTRHIKSDPALKELPVVLFSSLITEALRHKGEAVGADDQISKPDLPSLTRRVRGLIADKLGR